MHDHVIVAPKHALAFIAVTVLLDTIGFGLIMPVQPALLVELTGESVSRVATYGGWLAFVYAVMQFICAPILGNLSAVMVAARCCRSRSARSASTTSSWASRRR
jgi:MFS family permease